MTSNGQGSLQNVAAATALAVALSFSAAPPAAMAASTVATSSSESESATVTVKSIDLASRHLVVVNSAGEDVSLKVPSSVRNLAKVKAGDKIKATYTRETEFVISTPNTALPADTAAVVSARAAKGELPAAVVANGLVVSGSVLAIDMANHTLKIVSPKGGEVHTIVVRRADRQKAMAKLKVGDTITAYITESLLISVHPA
jgi:Cu/Ag efflux protein CusF